MLNYVTKQKKININSMKMIEMIIDEDEVASGIDAISVVETPAIQSNFVTLKEQDNKVELAEISKDKRLLLGAALIPDKPILRVNDDDEKYYIYFSKETVRKASELFAKRKFQDKATIEHERDVKGMTVVESWIVENKEKDKSSIYGLDVPVGTWCISMKADNEDIYLKAKEGKIKGFSIEGVFDNKEKDEKQRLEDEIQSVLEELSYVEMRSYNDYPQSARNNAKKALEWAEKNGWGRCGSAVGKQRANQLAKGENISRDTISRMASFARHRQHKDVPYSEGCGGLMWDAWGGTSGIEWAKNKLDKI
jgi:hypothetical protein